jgi:hypothetical protein
MSRRAWIRCLLISVLGTLVAPVVTMIPHIPAEGAEVADLKAIDPKKAARLSPRETAEYIHSIPMRRVEGWERLTYWFQHPNGLLFLRWTYWPAAVGWFMLFFVATVFVSYQATRERHGA